MNKIIIFFTTFYGTNNDLSLKQTSEYINYSALKINRINIKNKEKNLSDDIKIWIMNFEKEVFPFFKIFSYFEDPFKSKIVYLFVENIYNNEVVHYTVDITKKYDKIKLKKSLFCLYCNNNKIFDENFQYDENIIKESYITLLNIKPYKHFFSLIFNICSTDILNNIKIVERTNFELPIQLKTLKNIWILNNSKENYGFLICNFLTESFNFINSEEKYSRWILSDEIYKYEFQSILAYIQLWNTNLLSFYFISTNAKYYHLERLSNIIYQFCLQKKIYSNNFDRCLSFYIEKIYDKLDRLTIFLIYTKFICINKGYFVRYNMCNLFVYCWLYVTYGYQNFKEKNMFLQLLYSISYQKHPKSINYDFSDFACSYISSFSEMQRIFIKRLFFFYFNEEYSKNVYFLKSNKNQISWNFILCYIKLKCKIFSCQFIL